MQLTELFKNEANNLDLYEYKRNGGMTSMLSPADFLLKLKDMFQVKASTPEAAASEVIHILLKRDTSTARMYLSSIMKGAATAKIRIDYALRKAVEKHIHENADINGDCKLFD